MVFGIQYVHWPQGTRSKERGGLLTAWQLWTGRRVCSLSSPAQAPCQEQTLVAPLCLWGARPGPSCGSALAFACGSHHANSTAHHSSLFRSMAAHCRRNLCAQDLLVVAAHSGRKPDYLLNNVHFICDFYIPRLNFYISKSAHPIITPKPENKYNKRILNTLFPISTDKDSNQFSYVQMIQLH